MYVLMLSIFVKIMAQVLLASNNPIKHPYLRGTSKLRADRC